MKQRAQLCKNRRAEAVLSTEAGTHLAHFQKQRRQYGQEIIKEGETLLKEARK